MLDLAAAQSEDPWLSRIEDATSTLTGVAAEMKSVPERIPAVDDHASATMLDLLPDAVLLLDVEGRVRWGNQAAERLFGRRRDYSTGISALEFIHHDDTELVLRSLASVQEKDVGTLIEVRVATPGGWKLVEVVGRPVPELGRGCLLFCIRDLTDRRRFEVARDSIAKFRSLVQNAAFVTMLVSGGGTIESASAALTRLFGHDPERVEGHRLVELFAQQDRPRLDEAVKEAVKAASRRGRSPGVVTVEAGCRRGAGDEIVPVEVTIVPLLEDPTVEGLVVSMRDIADRVAAERELRETVSLLTATLDSTTDGILVVDRQGKIVSYNRRLAELWHIPHEVLATRDYGSARSFITTRLTDPDSFSSRVEELYSVPEAESFDLLSCNDGRVFEQYSRPQVVGDEIVGRVWSFRDVTEHKQLEDALTYRASHDQLTGLANRELFLEKVQQAVARTHRGRRVAILFLDVDGLKGVNDRLGHVAGDELLITVAEVLRSTTRAYDTVGRLGGDEFGVLVDDLPSEDDALLLAEHILAGLPRCFTTDDVSVEVSLSVGISFATPELTHLEVLRRADSAMYLAKQEGGRRWKLSTRPHS